jgi:hypothetical protein
MEYFHSYSYLLHVCNFFSVHFYISFFSSIFSFVLKILKPLDTLLQSVFSPLFQPWLILILSVQLTVIKPTYMLTYESASKLLHSNLEEEVELRILYEAAKLRLNWRRQQVDISFFC